MDYSITNDELFSSRPSFLERVMTMFSSDKVSLEGEVDGLRADYAMALDQCQMMKQHIQDLESKVDQINATIDLRPEAAEPEMPYSTAIVLAKRGCDREEIREACGLTDSETDLIITLHNKNDEHADNSMLAN